MGDNGNGVKARRRGGHCGSCLYFVPAQDAGGKGVASPDGSALGECHARPPMVVLAPVLSSVLIRGKQMGGMAPMGVWPPVRASQWCGFHPVRGRVAAWSSAGVAAGTEEEAE